jgi:transcription termination/antitermination protein NusG
MEKHDMACYLPLTKSLKVWSDRKKWVEEPLFRGYIFVPQNKLLADKLLQIPGVVNFVRYNGDKAIIKAEELKVLQHFIEQGYHIENVDLESINPGDFVEIQAGPFKGLKGEIYEKANKCEFTLSLESIGQVIKVNVPGEILKRV